MELCHIKSLETQEIRAVAGGRGRSSQSFVSLMPLDPWTCSVSSSSAVSLKNECSKLSCNMLQEIKGQGLGFLVGNCIFNVFRDSFMPSALTEWWWFFLEMTILFTSQENQMTFGLYHSNLCHVSYWMETLVFQAGLQEEMDIVACTIPKFTLERKTNQTALEENAAFFFVWPFQVSVLSLHWALSSSMAKALEKGD